MYSERYEPCSFAAACRGISVTTSSLVVDFITKQTLRIIVTTSLVADAVKAGRASECRRVARGRFGHRSATGAGTAIAHGIAHCYRRTQIVARGGQEANGQPLLATQRGMQIFRVLFVLALAPLVVGFASIPDSCPAQQHVEEMLSTLTKAPGLGDEPSSNQRATFDTCSTAARLHTRARSSPPPCRRCQTWRQK